MDRDGGWSSCRWLERYLQGFGMELNMRSWILPQIFERINRYEYEGSPYKAPQVEAAADETIVAMPFFATPTRGLGDSGHSSHEMRRAFLAMTFRGVSHFFKHQTVCVGTDFDEHYVKNESGLPFYDVMRIPPERMQGHARRNGATVPDPNVPFKAGCMGLATVTMIKLRLARDPRFARFRYVYYTESDQLPHIRNLGALLHTLRVERDRGTYAMFAPHRLVPLRGPRSCPVTRRRPLT